MVEGAEPEFVQSWMGNHDSVRGLLQFLVSLVLIAIYLGSLLPGLIFLYLIIPPSYFYLYPLAFPFSWTALLVLHVALKWLLIGRYKSGKHLLWSGYFFRWWFVNRLTALVYGFTSFFVTRDSILAKLWLLAAGARLSWSVKVRHTLADYDLIRIEAHCGVESAMRASILRPAYLKMVPVVLGCMGWSGQLHSTGKSAASRLHVG